MALDLDRLKPLDGRSVLVQPEIFDDQNSVGLRGRLSVRQDWRKPGRPLVEIVLPFPDMGDMAGEPAHEERIVLSEAEVARLLASEDHGAFLYTQRRRVDGATRTTG